MVAEGAYVLGVDIVHGGTGDAGVQEAGELTQVGGIRLSRARQNAFTPGRIEAGNERIAQIIGADRKIRHTYAGLDLRRAGNQVGTDRNSAGKGL